MRMQDACCDTMAREGVLVTEMHWLEQSLLSQKELVQMQKEARGDGTVVKAVWGMR